MEPETNPTSKGQDENQNVTKQTNTQIEDENDYEPKDNLPTLKAYPLLLTLKGHEGSIPTVRFREDGLRIASASSDRTARVWDLETGTVIHNLKDHQGGVSDAVYSEDGRFIATACDDAIIRLWDDRTGACVKKLTGHTHFVTSCCFSATGNLLISSSFDETVRLWDLRTDRQIGVVPAHSDPVISVDISKEMTKPLFVSASTDGVCRIWATENRQCCSSILPDPDNTVPIISAKFTPNNKFLLIGMLSSRLQLWDWGSFQYDKSRLNGGDEDDRPHIPKLVMRKSYIGHKNTKYAVHSAFLINEPSKRRYVLSGSEDHHAYAWDLNERKIVGILRGKERSSDDGDGHCDVVQGIATNPKTPMIATSAGEKDRTVKIWKYKENS